MTDASTRLILNGFFSKKLKADYPDWSKWDDAKKKAALKPLKDDTLEAYADHDKLE